MRTLFLYSFVSFLGLAAAELNATCELIPNLPQCAENCLTRVTAHESDCSSALHNVCHSQHSSVSSCYQDDCHLIDYLRSMNITNTVCEIPPRNRETVQVAVGSVFIALTSITVILRLFGRPPFSEAFWIDDVFALLGFFASMGDTVIMIVGAKVGWGTDMWALTSAEMMVQMRYFYIGIILFYFSVSVTKLAILFFYLRIFTSQSFKRQTYVVIGLSVSFGLAAVFQSAFDCTPASYFWTRFDPTYVGTCLSESAFKAIAPINIVLDVIILVLPLPSIFRLNLPFAKKIRVTLMFCVGILILIAGTLRLTHLFDSITTYNITYNGGQISYFGVIESDVSVICTCMPPLAILLKRIFPKWFGSTVDRGYHTFKSTDTFRTRHTSTLNPQKQASIVSPTFYNPSSSVVSTHVTSGPASTDSDDIKLIDMRVEDDDSYIQRPERTLTYK